MTDASTGPMGRGELPRSRRRLLRAALAALLVCAIAATAVWGWHWRTHPDVFPGHGIKVTVPVPSGEDSAMVGLTSPGSDPDGGETVTIHSVTPRVMKNTAGATFEFYVCTLPDNNMGGVAALHGRRFDEYCLEPLRVDDGTRLDTSSAARQQLLMLIHLDKPGAVTTDGAELTYSHGFRRGTQTVGTHVRLVSRD